LPDYEYLPNGSRETGRIDLFLGAEDGVLTARIVVMEIPGMEINDPLVDQINAGISSELSWIAYDPNISLRVNKVMVTSDALCLNIHLSVNSQEKILIPIICAMPVQATGRHCINRFLPIFYNGALTNNF
jgi:hypothetical protein